MVLEKVTNAGRVLVMGYTTIFVLENFRFPITDSQIRILWAGVVILTVMTLLSGIGRKSEQNIQKVFEAKKVEANGQYPKLIKRG